MRRILGVQHDACLRGCPNAVRSKQQNLPTIIGWTLNIVIYCHYSKTYETFQAGEAPHMNFNKAKLSTILFESDIIQFSMSHGMSFRIFPFVTSEAPNPYGERRIVHPHVLQLLKEAGFGT